MRRLAALLLIAAAGSAPAAAQPAYLDPWDPATVAAAEAAVARLGPARGAVGLRASVLAIPGLTLGIGGGGTGLVASVQELEAAKRDLGAQETALVVRVELPADVLFDFDKAEIRADAAGALGQLATVLRGFPNGTARLEGHTDAKGDDAYNQRLSERRAAAVKTWLVEREGLDAGRLTTRGWGESKPAASNDDDAGRQKNRRVSVIIKKQ
ncbi:MAG TPA: OmpA family protein [Thermoanaerobaculia bacterium]|nr:OmpA family protein [Thermoanaerobaculia bacterium]